MNNKFKKGDYIEPKPNLPGFSGFEHEKLFKVKGIQQSTKEYLLVSLSAPNLKRVLKASITAVNLAYRRLPTRKGRNKAEWYKMLYKADVDV